MSDGARGIGAAMVLAAGFGTRMGALTRDRPKPLLSAGGRALIDHALDLVDGAGIGRAVVNLHYHGQQIRAHLAGRRAPRIAFSDEQPEILDTGGGVVRALPLLGPGPFAVLNSDAVFAGPNPVPALVSGWDPARMDALMLLVPVVRAHAYSRAGDFFLPADGAAPARRGDAAAAPYVFTGAQILSPGALERAPAGPFSLNLCWDRLLAAGRLAAIVYPGAWIDVGTPEGLAQADRLLAAA